MNHLLAAGELPQFRHAIEPSHEDDASVTLIVERRWKTFCILEYTDHRSGAKISDIGENDQAKSSLEHPRDRLGIVIQASE